MNDAGETEKREESVLRSPRRSICKQAVAVEMCRESVCRILTLDLNFRPYKLQIVQLRENDYQLRLAFCQQMITNINKDDDFLSELLMSDETHFHLTNYVNKQNYRYWADTNPNEVLSAIYTLIRLQYGVLFC